MRRNRCEKHGLLSPSEVVMWNNGTGNRWCVHCVNKMMYELCGRLIVMKDDEGYEKWEKRNGSKVQSNTRVHCIKNWVCQWVRKYLRRN